MQTVEAGALSNFFNKLMDSFFKSIEGLFSEGKEDTKFGKGKIVWQRAIEPTSPVLDEAGKPLPKAKNVFVTNMLLEYPKEIKMTRETALKVFEDEKTWADADKLRNISVEASLGNKDKLTKRDTTAEEARKLINDYCKEHQILQSDGNGGMVNVATSAIWQKTMIYTEVATKEEETKPESEQNQDGNQGNNGNASASNRLKMSLKKVVGSAGTAITLTKITANYDILAAMKDLNTIVSDDAFVDQLPDNTEVNYEVTSDETDYDVNECEDFNCEEIIQQMIYSTLNTSIQLRLLSMMGPRDSYGRSLIAPGDMSYTFDSILDVLGGNLIDMSAEYIPGFEFSTEIIDSEVDPAERAITVLEDYLQSLQVVYDCLTPGSQYKLSQQMGQLEDNLRALRQS